MAHRIYIKDEDGRDRAQAFRNGWGEFTVLLYRDGSYHPGFQKMEDAVKAAKDMVCQGQAVQE